MFFEGLVAQLVEQCPFNSKQAFIAIGNFRQLAFSCRNFANGHNGFVEIAFFTGDNFWQLAALCFSVWGCKNGMQKSFQEMDFRRFRRWTFGQRFRFRAVRDFIHLACGFGRVRSADF